MTHEMKTEKMLELSLHSVPAAQVRFPAVVVNLCLREHRAGPVFPCPVCFLLLVYSQPLLDFGRNLAVAVVKEREKLGAELADGAQAVLDDLATVKEKLARHVVQASVTPKASPSRS